MASYLACGDADIMKQQWARMCSKQATLDGQEPNPERATKRPRIDASTRPKDLKLHATPGTIEEKTEEVPHDVRCMNEVRSIVADWASGTSPASPKASPVNFAAQQASPKQPTPRSPLMPSRPSPEAVLIRRPILL